MRSNRLGFSASSIVLGAAIALAGTAALAQPAATPLNDQNVGAGAGTNVGEVVVTAQKRAERSVNVPISIAAFSGRQLEQRNVVGTTQLQSLTPGLRMDQTGIFVVPTIRGIGTPVTGSGLSPTAIYVDGVYQQDAAGGLFDVNNVSSIQVLKGPQGTLFGRNTEAGAILITTLDPTARPTIRFNADVGSYNERKANLYLSGPIIGDALTGNLAVYTRHNDGYLTNIFTGSKTDGHLNIFSIQGKIRWAPTDRINFILKYAHNDMSDGSAANYVALVDPATGRPFATANYVVPPPGAPPVMVSDSNHPYTTANDAPPLNRVLQDAVTLKSTFDFGWATLTSYSSGVWDRNTEAVDQDSSNQVLSEFFPWRVVEQYAQQELNLAGHWNNRLDWVTGVYLAYDRSTTRHFYSRSGGPSAIVARNVGVTTGRDLVAAFFADGNYRVTDNLFIDFGARYSTEKKTQLIFGSVTAPNNNFKPAEQTFNSFTPRASIRYQFTPNSNVYFTYSEGFKSGLFSTLANGTAINVRPESLTAFEAGFKASSSRFNFAVAVFHYTYKDLQFQNTIAGLGSIVSNAGNARSFGGEFSVTYAVNENITLDLSGAYTNARYTSFKHAVISYPCTAAIISATVCGNKVDNGDFQNTDVDVTGKTMIRAPEFTMSFGPDWKIPTSVGLFDLSANLYVSSRVYFQADDALYFSQAPYATLNLNATWSPSPHYTLGVYATNVTDAKIMNQSSPDGASARLRYAAPLQAGITFAYRN